MSTLVKSLQDAISLQKGLNSAEQTNLKKLLDSAAHGTIPEGIDTVEDIIKKLQRSPHHEEEDEGRHLESALHAYIKTATDKPDLKKYYYTLSLIHLIFQNLILQMHIA